jgi:hypothetical protein
VQSITVVILVHIDSSKFSSAVHYDILNDEGTAVPLDHAAWMRPLVV